MKPLADAPQVVQFLLDRGLDPDFVSKCGVKALDDMRIAYPLWNGWWKIRHVVTKDMLVLKFGIEADPMPAVFGHLFQEVQSEGADFHVHLCEGETDALSMAQLLWQLHLPGATVAVPGIHNLHHAVGLLRPMLGTGVHVTMYPDPDAAGETMARAASTLGAHVVQLPPGKDLCEYLGGLRLQDRWPALQLLRHHAATYVPYDASQSQRERRSPTQASDVPPGVLSYFQKIVTELVPDCGYADVEKINCPWHEDPNASLNMDWNRCIWYCHGCGLGGGVKKWAQLAADR